MSNSGFVVDFLNTVFDEQKKLLKASTEVMCKICYSLLLIHVRIEDIYETLYWLSFLFVCFCTECKRRVFR